MAPKPRRSATAPDAAPPLDQALASLARRHLRAITLLGVRLVAVAILTSLLEARIPALQGRALLLDAVGAVLVLWPFYTALGRIFAWRIALGRAYARERRWAEAERTLRPLARVRYQVFDATGEGAYWLGVALRGLGRNQEAGHLFRSVARQRRGTWQEKAAAEARSLP